MMKYTKVNADLAKHRQLNAGIIVESFNTSTKEIGGIVGATSGGVNFSATPTYIDMFDGVDNVPTNTKEGKRLDYYEVKMSGTFAECTKELAVSLLGPADADGVKIVTRAELEEGDFKELWWIGDYSDVNTGENAGYMAIHMLNVLNTNGFNIQSANKGTGTHSFEYTAHYSLSDPDKAPFEIYISEGK